MVKIYPRLGSPRLETEQQRGSAVTEARLTSSHSDGIRVPATIEPRGGSESVFAEEDYSDVVGFSLPLRGALPGRLL